MTIGGSATFPGDMWRNFLKSLMMYDDDNTTAYVEYENLFCVSDLDQA